MPFALDGGMSFDEFRQVDDNPGGANQRHPPIHLNERSQTTSASWENRRGGANVYFSWSEDWGQTWEDNIDVHAGMGGDQFRPQAVVDVAGSVYVAMLLPAADGASSSAGSTPKSDHPFSGGLDIMAPEELHHRIGAPGHGPAELSSLQGSPAPRFTRQFWY